MKKRVMFAILLIAMVVLTLMPVSLVRAEDVWRPPLSGSDCDATTLEYGGHTIAEGFAASISANLPLDGHTTQLKFGCAVAGLGDPWETGPMYGSEYVPYVKEMWIRVEGDHHYSDQEDAIFDNTGTGESSCGLFEAVLTMIGIVFNAWQIYDWLAEIYQQPPDAEWKVNGHWTKAIIRQKTEPGWNPPGVRYVNPDEPRLQTATANIMPAFFEEGGSYVLNITAQTEIYVQQYTWYNNYIQHHHIGTYRVSFEVSVDPACAMKTEVDGEFYVPSVTAGLLKIEMLFNDADIEGDQTGGTSPYGTINRYPDGTVNIIDLSFIGGAAMGSHEGDENWDYMADVVPDKVISIRDLYVAAHNFGKSGTYITSLAGVTVTFDVGGTKSPNPDDGSVTIPQDATSFTVKRYGTPIGAMIIFW